MPDLRIVFLLPNIPRAVGGIKVFHQVAETLIDLGVSSAIYHPFSPTISPDWFQSSAPVLKSLTLDPVRDLYVIPEMWANKLGPQLMEKGLRFGLYVQNGYLINSPSGETDHKTIKAVYEGATFIWSVSDYCIQMIRQAFPALPPAKIKRLTPPVGQDFRGQRRKKRLISYMPRKSPFHSEQIQFFATEYLPPNWSFQEINDVPHDIVVERLARSSIFLSLSAEEGLGLPPLEAAASGNHVIGFMGGAGREYFHPPVFSGIEQNEIFACVKELTRGIERVERGLLSSKTFIEGVRAVRARYSYDQFTASLRGILDGLS